jgi:hypothetical protein
MDKKEVRLNANKRKSLVIDFRKHCESLDTHEKEAFLQSRDDAKSTIESSFATCKEVVERRFPLEDVATLQTLQRKHNTINAVGEDSCFFFKVTDAPKVLDRYNDEVDKSRHFSFELDGSMSSDYGSRYSGSSNDGKNFAYAMYREDMKAVGLNPDCNIENDIQQEGKMGDQRYSRTTNPYLSQCRNDNHHWLQGGQGGTNYYQSWKDKHALHIIGTGGCRSRAIPCTELEFAKFEMMHQAKQNVVLKHTKWIQSVVAKVKAFEKGIKQMTKFSQVEKFAEHPKINWQISSEILADKIGMDIVVSIDDLADSIASIGEAKPDRNEKIAQRLAYEQWQKSQAVAN